MQILHKNSKMNNMNIRLKMMMLCLLTGMLTIGYSQAKELRLKKLHYENSLGEKGVTTFFYSQSNKNYKAKWELLDGSRYSINYHTLDEQGNMLRKYREFSDSLVSNNFYKYDSDGNLIEDYFERSDNVKGIVWYKYKDGKKVEAECRGMNGWFFGVIRYQYTGDILSSAIIIKEAQKVGSIEYTYDQNGNLEKEYWDFGGKWNQAFVYEYEIPESKQAVLYTYSSPLLKETDKFLVTSENYSWNNESSGPSYYYYEGNKLIKKIYKLDSLETVTTYEYDNDGLLMKSFRNYADGRKAEFSYHYDENRRLIRRLFFLSNVLEGSESYIYNEKGQLEFARWNKFDTWLSGTISFKYNDNNLLQSAEFKGKDKFDANIQFENNKDGNLIKIHWDFSFGKSQTYWFEYKKL